MRAGVASRRTRARLRDPSDTLTRAGRREQAQRRLGLAVGDLPLRRGREAAGVERERSVLLAAVARGVVHRRHHLALGTRGLDEELVREAVLEGVEQVAVRGLAVASGAAGLLVVRLERTRHRMMHDEPHVALVDPHAERVRRDDRAHLLRHERVLHLAPARVVEAGVVGLGADAGAREHVGHAIHGLARGGVDDRDAVVAGEQLDEGAVLLGVVLRAHHVPAQVRAVESREHDLRVAQRRARARCRGAPPAWRSR